MKIPTFEEFINERLFSSSIDRIKSGNVRKEEKMGLDDDEYKVYKIFDKWSNELRILEPVFSENKQLSNQRQFLDDLLKEIKASSEIKRLYEWSEVTQALKENYAIFYTTKNCERIYLCFIYDNKFIDLTTYFYFTTNEVLVVMTHNKRLDIDAYTKKHDIPYNAYRLPLNAIKVIFEQQECWDKVKKFYN